MLAAGLYNVVQRRRRILCKVVQQALYDASVLFFVIRFYESCCFLVRQLFQSLPKGKLIVKIL